MKRQAKSEAGAKRAGTGAAARPPRAARQRAAGSRLKLAPLHEEDEIARDGDRRARRVLRPALRRIHVIGEDSALRLTAAAGAAAADPARSDPLRRAGRSRAGGRLRGGEAGRGRLVGQGPAATRWPAPARSWRRRSASTASPGGCSSSSTSIPASSTSSTCSSPTRSPPRSAPRSTERSSMPSSRGRS